MTIEEVVKMIEKTANAARKSCQYVIIDSVLPTVYVYRGEDDDFHFQEHEANDLLSQVPDYADPEDYILYIAQGW